MRNERHAFIYIMSNKWKTVLYIGVTNDLMRRVWEHKNNKIGSFVTKYRVTQLVYYEEFDDIRDAIFREKVLKGWRRSRKDKLVESMNPTWIDLYEKWKQDDNKYKTTTTMENGSNS